MLHTLAHRPLTFGELGIDGLLEFGDLLHEELEARRTLGINDRFLALGDEVHNTATHEYANDDQNALHTSIVAWVIYKKTLYITQGLSFVIQIDNQ